MKLNLSSIQDKFRAASVLTITIESDRLILDLIKRQNGSCVLLQSVPLSLSAESIVQNAEAAGKNLATALASAKIRERQCVVCLPPQWALAAQIDLPALETEDLYGYLELQAERKFPMPASELKLAYCPYTTPEGHRKASLAAISSKRVDAVKQMLEAAGCKTVSISLGLDFCINQNGNQNSGSIQFLANGNHIDFVVSAGGGIVGLRSLPFPSSQSTDKTIDPKWLYQELRMTLGKLPQDMVKEVREVHFPKSFPSIETKAREIQEVLHQLNIQGGIIGSKTNTGSLSIKTADRYLHKKPVAFEFITSQNSQFETILKWFGPKRRRWIVLTPIVLLAIPMIAFVVQSNKENQLQAEWKKMKPSVDALDVLQNKLRQFRPWFNPAPQSIQILDGLMSIFPEQGDVWAKSIEIKENSKIVCEAFSKTEPARLEFLERLRKRPEVTELAVQQIHGGKTSQQFSFTFIWKQKNED
jgi:hypothetical protein